ncbi:LysM peptidoglycan-binding domain-containing protein [Agromyces sp. NPDC056523]|uniref:LysM peptidoglycan-binding domain-containing protein n=1 Tax=Agromyces sp. NPDC056523 TaxID=3345850 RepID=UPI00366AE6BC
MVTARRWARSVGMAALILTAATGCAVAVPGPAPSDAAIPATADPVSASEATSSEVPPSLSDVTAGTVIASGAFLGRGTDGRIEITANGADHGFDVALIGVSPAPPNGTSLELNALPATATDEELQQGFSYYTDNPLQQVADQTLAMPSSGYGGFETNDPSYMRTAVIWAASPGAPVGLGSVVATAALTWDLPDMNPGLAVVDRGPDDGARGAVTLAPDGTPSTYRVAWGDTPDGITERFGITLDDLEWLNPDRLTTRLVLADLTLNLARGSRGLRG